MRRLLLFLLLCSCTLFLALLSFAPKPLPVPFASVKVQTPYAKQPLLREYDRLFRAEVQGDLRTIRRYVKTGPQGYLRYRNLLSLARNTQLPAKERLGYLERVLAYELISPLARGDTRQAQLELGLLAEQTNARSKALAAYRQALPLRGAVLGLRRLEPRPRHLAHIFLEEGHATLALEALRGVSAPALRAPALAALGEDPFALAAYNRWLLRNPRSSDALEGKIAVLIDLERFGDARNLLDRLPPHPELEVALAEAQDDTAGLIRAYRNLIEATNDDAARWELGGLLEQRGTPRDALPLYEELAQGDSDLQDDAAYRLYTLETRLGRENMAYRARGLIPADSFFQRRLQVPFVPPNGTLERVALPVIAKARALALVGEQKAAVGELLIALRDAHDEKTTVALAEALQALGEYGASSEAARAWIERGSRALHTYQAAYPRPYLQTVRAQAHAHALDPNFVWAVMRQESHFYPRALSTSDAQGLLQIVPATWNYLAELLGEAPADPFAPPNNIRYGTFYLSTLLETFEGSLTESAAAYNGGPGYVGRLLEEPFIRNQDDFLRFIDRTETREYVARVMHNLTVYRALYR